jgi:hypothetical protein
VRNVGWLSLSGLAVSSSVPRGNANRLVGCFALAACLLVPARPSRAGFTQEELERNPPDRRETTDRRVHSLTTELAAIAKRHGPDSVALQAGLLVNALHSGAVGACEVTVVGASPQAGPSFLEIDVATGLIFDTDTSTPASRTAHVWRTIAAPTLKGMKSFETTPPGLELVFQYGVQRFADSPEHKADARGASEPHSVRVAIPEAALADLLAGSLDVDALLDRASVRDGATAIPAGDLHPR